jgi:fatty acid desaturase
MNAHSPLIAGSEIKRLSTLSQWRSMGWLALDWLVIAAAIAVSEYSGSWIVYVFAILVIAGRQHGIGVLVHEAAHYRMLKNRKLNDWVVDVLAAWPMLATVASYRRNHLAHHQNTNTEDDPDWMTKIGRAAFTFPQKMRDAILYLAGYLVAVNTFRDLAHVLPRISKNDTSTPGYKIMRVTYFAAIIALFGVLGVIPQFILYWIVPYFTVLFLFFHVRNVAEHFGDMDYSEELTSSRTVVPYFWERWCFGPHNVHYHLEHHLYPSVPFYNLPELHRLLMKNEFYRGKAHLTRGYSTGLARECFGQARREAKAAIAAE